ncbi:hypothetical protein GQ651_02890 [Alphaproteobacteria bacterium GH1-50]|uniref:DUF1127 domain-containing protein n=1 Tax=Kangsaoukella pontilimi TaxID=2691042 RepID=A0A7C9IRB6_9RHOB|nr:hypothetical protein [Kangsaoukella pontilimi]MXQ06785.1 hypothetical protein [Kangsaoukella pontilimi]
MTDLSAPLQSGKLKSPLARILRLPLALVKSLFGPRPGSDVDLRRVNERFLRDIGLRR